MIVLGLDPAAAGAAVLMRDSQQRPEVLGVACWRTRTKAGKTYWVASFWPGGEDEWCATPGQLGSRIAVRLSSIAVPTGFVMEGAYLGKMNPKSSLRIARFGGMVAGGIQAMLGISAYEVAPSEWRSILGLSAKDRAAAKAKCLAGMPMLIPSIGPAMTHLGPERDDVTDACGVAAIGLRCGADRPGFEDRVGAARPRR